MRDDKSGRVGTVLRLIAYPFGIPEIVIVIVKIVMELEFGKFFQGRVGVGLIVFVSQTLRQFVHGDVDLELVVPILLWNAVD